MLRMLANDRWTDFSSSCNHSNFRSRLMIKPTVNWFLFFFLLEKRKVKKEDGQWKGHRRMKEEESCGNKKDDKHCRVFVKQKQALGRSKMVALNKFRSNRHASTVTNNQKQTVRVWLVENDKGASERKEEKEIKRPKWYFGSDRKQHFAILLSRFARSVVGAKPFEDVYTFGWSAARTLTSNSYLKRPSALIRRHLYHVLRPATIATG